jgi:type IV pilus assembly protein PilC
MATLNPALTPGVSAQTLAIAFRELAALQRAGVRLDDSLEQAAGAGPVHFRQALEGLAGYVRAGHPLAEGMGHYGALFHPIIPAIVGAGEASGNLDTSFALLSDYFEAETQLKRVIQSAMVYPTIVVVVAILAVGLLSFLTVPMGDGTVQSIMPGTWAVRLIWLLAIAVAIWLILRFRTVQVLARYLVMAIPFFGGIMYQLAVARFCQTFGLLIRAGVPYLEGLQTSLTVAQHPAVEHSIRHLYASVRNGVTVEEAVRHNTQFPRIVQSLVGAGEMSGNLDVSFVKAAEFLRDDAEYKVKNSAKAAGPVMLLIVAVIVGLIVMQFFQRYFEIVMSFAE